MFNKNRDNFYQGYQQPGYVVPPSGYNLNYNTYGNLGPNDIPMQNNFDTDYDNRLTRIERQIKKMDNRLRKIENEISLSIDDNSSSFIL